MATLEEVLRNFDERLQKIESTLAISTPKADKAKPSAPSFVTHSFKPTTRREERPSAHSSSFLGVIGIVFVLLATVFFIKLSIDSGWLTPLRQVSLAALFGLFCLLLPHFVTKLITNYGALLSGAGVVILHLTWYGAFQVHQLISVSEALLFASLVGILSVAMNAKIGNRIFVLVAIAGTYLSAPLIGFKNLDPETLSQFLLVWNISFSLLGFFLSRREMLFVAAYFAIMLVGLLSLSELHLSVEMARAYLLQQGMQFAIFALSMFAYSIFHKVAMSESEAWLLFPVLLLLYGNLRKLLEVLAPELGVWIGMGFALIVLLLYFLATIQFRKGLQSGAPILCFFSLVLFHSAYIELTPDLYKPLVSLLLAVFFALGNSQRWGDIWRWPSIIIILAIGFGAILSLTHQFPSPIDVVYNALFGVAALLGSMGWNKTKRDGYPMILGFAHLEVLVAIYRLSLKLESGALFVSSAWGVYAILILLWALKAKDKFLGNSAILILVAVGLKACFYDLWQTGNLSRVLSLLVSGLLLYGCGWIYQRMSFWKNPQ